MQLLTETGILGLAFFLICFGVILFLTIRNIKTIVINESMKKFEGANLFSLGIQIFFLMYCVTGCPLYSTEMMLMYTLSIAIMISTKIYIKKEKIKN